MTRPVSNPAIDAALTQMIEQSDILIADPREHDAALSLARNYARWLMAHREKSPTGDGLSIMQNQFIRGETYKIVAQHAPIRKHVPQYEQ